MKFNLYALFFIILYLIIFNNILANKHVSDSIEIKKVNLLFLFIKH